MGWFDWFGWIWFAWLGLVDAALARFMLLYIVGCAGGCGVGMRLV